MAAMTRISASKRLAVLAAEIERAYCLRGHESVPALFVIRGQGE
jgi:hypothetical protein